jgi:hypothetical protein
MAKKPNYQFERRERDRAKAAKMAEKAAAKRELKERERAAAPTDGGEQPPANED